MIHEKFLNELKISNGLESEGVCFEPSIFAKIFKENPNLKNYHDIGDFSVDDTVAYDVPREARLESGIGFMVKKDAHSPYSFEVFEDGIYVVKNSRKLSKIHFASTRDFYKQKTSDGVSMRKIARGGSLEYGEGSVAVAYSDECALLQTKNDCLFCNINETKRRFNLIEEHEWKYPGHIGETVKAAYAEGCDHFNITGGFVPERRELDYYLDVAESIQKETGLEDFNGTAVIGAPEDLTILEKYKEAGYRTVAIHLEVWGKNYFDTICPGKAATGGGYDNYIAAIDYALEVFGKNRVRTQFVAGLQPKEYLYEGLEIMAQKGAIPLTLPWIPCIGSAFEGHRSPTEEWHWEVLCKNYDVLKKNQVSYESLYDVLPARRLIQDFYRAEAAGDSDISFLDKRKTGGSEK